LSLIDGCAVFNHIFATELSNGGYPDGLDDYRYRDEYNGRNLAGRSAMWKTICATNVSGEEQRQRDVLMGRIRTAVTALGLDASAITAAAVDVEQEDEQTTEAAAAASSEPPRKKCKSQASTAPRPSFTREPEDEEGSYTVNEEYVAFHPEEMFRELSNGRYLPIGTNKTRKKPVKKQKPPASEDETNATPSQANKELSETFAGGDEANVAQVGTQQTPPRNKKPAAHEAASFRPTSTGLPLRQSSTTTSHSQLGMAAQQPEAPLTDQQQAGDEQMTDATTTDAPASSATVPLMQMIHHSAATTTWNGTTPLSHPSAFIRQTDEVYYLGGKVYRAMIDEKEQDVMVCEHDHCASCKLSDKTGKRVIVAESKTGGLPFVHSGNLQAHRGQGFTFVPPAKVYPEGYPKHMWKTNVKFWDGQAREVMVCEHSRCKDCAGKEAVEKKAARYLPGGDLYEMKKRQEAARGGSRSRLFVVMSWRTVDRCVQACDALGVCCR
jgi:hypothetical protein